MKNCTKCGEMKPFSMFSPKKGAADGLMSHCRPCRNKQGREKRQDDGDRKREQGRRASRKYALKKKFNLTEDQYLQIFLAQESRCAICKRQPRTRRLAVDHDHKTGEVRGLLCMYCNRYVLGGAHEKVEILEQAIQYLREPPARQVLDKAATLDKED